MNVLARGFVGGVKALPQLLAAILRLLPALWNLLCSLWRALRTLCRDRRCRDRTGCCVDVPPKTYKRADPLIYSQHYLMAQGLSVTWDNPDVQLFRGGLPVPSSALEPATDYEVEIRVWNNSYDAPAAGLRVYLSFLSFGAGTTSTYVGSRQIDLGVKGSAQAPAFARIPWRTPGEPGHYCLQARLDWPDDANPDNNLGQENTNVGQLHSPAEFQLTVGNQAGVRRRFELEVDMYELPEPEPCPPADQEPRDEDLPPNRQPRVPRPYASRKEESRAHWKQALAQQAYGSFPVTSDWAVALDPDTFSLDAGDERLVRASIEPRSPGFTGRQPFNVHVFATADNGDRRLVGGVTLVVERS